MAALSPTPYFSGFACSRRACIPDPSATCPQLPATVRNCPQPLAPAVGSRDRHHRRHLQPHLPNADPTDRCNAARVRSIGAGLPPAGSNTSTMGPAGVFSRLPDCAGSLTPNKLTAVAVFCGSGRGLTSRSTLAAAPLWLQFAITVGKQARKEYLPGETGHPVQ